MRDHSGENSRTKVPNVVTDSIVGKLRGHLDTEDTTNKIPFDSIEELVRILEDG